MMNRFSSVLSSSFQPLLVGAFFCFLGAIAPAAEPPPLDARIIEMMKTNTAGIVEARIHFVEKWEISPVEKAQVFFIMFDEYPTGFSQIISIDSVWI